MTKSKDLLKIIEKAGLEAPEKEKLMDFFEEVLNERVLAALTNQLGEAEAAELEAKLSGEVAPEDVLRFFQEKLPDYKKIVADAIADTQKNLVDFLTKHQWDKPRIRLMGRGFASKNSNVLSLSLT